MRDPDMLARARARAAEVRFATDWRAPARSGEVT